MRTGAIVGRVLLWTLIAVVALYVPHGMTEQVSRLWTLMAAGRTVDGQVLDSRVRHGKSTTYYLTVSFSDRGFSFSGEREVPMGIFNRYSGQSAIPVLTMPTDPTDFEVGPIDESRINYLRTQWLIFGGGAFLVVLIFVISFEYTSAVERGLLANGQVGTGCIDSVYRGRSTIVRYEFETPYGARTGKFSPAFRRPRIPEIGSQIEVLYDPNNDRRSIPLKMVQLWQLDGTQA
ncbi:MAG: hypothetical protein P4L46_22130 [Fimbriimonas sp.]|nr:hypothetical protein [Fimbriimonas sp.]